MTRARYPARIEDAFAPPPRARLALTVVGIAAAALCLPPDGAWAAKEKFVRNKPHVNVGTIGMTNETLTLRLELVDTVEVATGNPTGNPCTGVVDMRIEDAVTGSVLASRSAVTLVAGTVEALSHTVSSATALVRLVIVADQMQVDGKTCALRGQVELTDLADGRIRRSFPVRREDFVAVKLK